MLKTRLQSGAITTLSSGIADIFQSEGLFGFFAGYGATLLRDVPYTMMELGFYENIKSIIRSSRGGLLTSSDELSAAAITGAITGYLTSTFVNIHDVALTYHIDLMKKKESYIKSTSFFSLWFLIF